MFESFKRFFSKKKATVQDTVEPKKEIDLSKIGVELFGAHDKIESSLENTDEDYFKGAIKRYQQDLKEGVSMSKFLVVLDTQNRPEVKDRGLQGGLKNFYIVDAKSTKQAKEMVMSTFAHNPGVLSQIQYSFTVTNLADVVKTVTGQSPVWSYVPFRANHKAPGQKATPPSQMVNPRDSDEVIPMKEPSAPITPTTQDDTPSLKQGQQMANSEMMQNNPMMAMFGMMAQMMQNPEMAKMMEGMQGNQPQNSRPPEPVIKKVDPTQDPDLMERMKQNLDAQKARHVHHTGIGDAVVGVEHGEMPELEDAEAQARAEIDAFKRLPKNDQSAAGSLVVKNDIKPEDMEQFRKIQKRNRGD